MDCCFLCDSIGLCCAGCAVLAECMPMAFGCPSRLKADGESIQRICPTCNDLAVSSATAERWVMCFFIPTISLRSERYWVCSTCEWRAPIVPGGREPAVELGFLEGRRHQPIVSQQPASAQNGMTTRTSQDMRKPAPPQDVPKPVLPQDEPEPAPPQDIPDSLQHKSESQPQVDVKVS